MNPFMKPVNGLLRRVGEMTNRPIGLSGPHGPLNPLNIVGRFRGPGSLEEAVRERVILVTGASSGIGEATALHLGRAGANVLLVARREEKLEELADRVAAAGGTAHVHRCDLSDTAEIERMGAEVLDRHGRVDVLVNNAGRSIRRSVALSYDRYHDYERVMQLNYFGAVRLILLLLPGMRERGRGHVVNISSAGVLTKTPRFSGYIASKAALDAFSDAVAAETLDDGVRFTTIYMPLVRTPMIAPTGIYRRFPAATPDEAAEMVCDAILHRPRRVTPAFGHASAISDALSPLMMDSIRNRAYKMFPDSGAAQGAVADGGAPEEATRSAQAFAHATRGTHW